LSIGVVLTILFVVLIVTGTVSWPLWVAFMPLVGEVVIDILLLVVFGSLAFWVSKR